ncbi:hypothetical protein [Dietzia sp. 179-F 9C3 NHS]|uniref:hypothetical protein n=1 Tax=Dietzia sp. 179-F 9C3 NHS TaxID=3374295 RepID=UPI00387A7E9B
MTTHRPGKLATATAAIALATATTVAAPVAHAAPAEGGTVHHVSQATASATGSLENELVQAGLIIVAGLGVSALLAVAAGVAGGGIELPPMPTLPF